MIRENGAKVFVTLLLIIIFIVDSIACADLLLDKQVENHFNKYLTERNRFDGIECLGGPFLRKHYSKSSQGKITNYTYDRPLGILGDPNQINIKAYFLTSPVKIKSFDVATLKQLNTDAIFLQGSREIKEAIGEIFKIVKKECSRQWCQKEFSIYTCSGTKEQFMKKDLENEPYFCGIESLDTNTWQLYFRRGHRFHDYFYEDDKIKLLPLTLPPADILKAKSGKIDLFNSKNENRKGTFLLYGQFDKSKSNLTNICNTLRENSIPVIVIQHDKQKTMAIYNQEENAGPFGHPYLNAPVYSIILNKNKETFQILSLSTVIEEIPGGVRQSYGDVVGLLLARPPNSIIEEAVNKLNWPGWCDPKVEKYLTQEDLFQICELYLRVPFPEIDYPEFEIEKINGRLRVKISPQGTGDYGRPTLTLVKINNMWRVYPCWDLEDYF